MPSKNRAQKKAIRARQAETGEPYNVARRNIEAAAEEVVWEFHLTDGTIVRTDEAGYIQPAPQYGEDPAQVIGFYLPAVDKEPEKPLVALAEAATDPVRAEGLTPFVMSRGVPALGRSPKWVGMMYRSLGVDMEGFPVFGPLPPEVKNMRYVGKEPRTFTESAHLMLTLDPDPENLPVVHSDGEAYVADVLKMHEDGTIRAPFSTGHKARSVEEMYGPELPRRRLSELWAYPEVFVGGYPEVAWPGSPEGGVNVGAILSVEKAGDLSAFEGVAERYDEQQRQWMMAPPEPMTRKTT